MTPSEKVGFRDVKAEVMNRLGSGFWGPGAQLPGEVDLAAEFGCSRATVNRALRELSAEGIIDRRRKAGTHVKLSPVRQVKFEIPLVRIEVQSHGAEYRYALISRVIAVAPDWLRVRLDLPQSALVLHLHCMHYSNGEPFQFEDRWINLDAVPKAAEADFTVNNPNEWLLTAVPFSNAEVRFSASAAASPHAEFLQVPQGSPLFTAERTTWNQGKPVTNTRLYFAAGYTMVARY